jgi:copper/silver efflux system protein
MDVVEIGLGGLNVSTTVEGRARYPIQLRLARDEHEDIEKIGSILIPTKGGFSVPLGQVASIRRSSGASEISSEDGLLRVFVQSNVRGRDLGGSVRDVQRRIAETIDLPPGVTLKWSGQYESQLSAQRTLMLIVPVVLLIIFMLLSMVFHSVMKRRMSSSRCPLPLLAVRSSSTCSDTISALPFGSATLPSLAPLFRLAW